MFAVGRLKLGIDSFDVTGTATLGNSTLEIELLDGFTPLGGDNYIVASTGSITGAFGNGANGARLTTIGGEGSFIVNYGAGSVFASTLVVLSNYLAAPPSTAVPELGTASLALVALACLACRNVERSPGPFED